MSKMLASVSSAAEAGIMLATACSIIDLKQPRQGVLGALPLAVVRQIVGLVAGGKTVSATIGDLPMCPDNICAAVADMSKTGVDYIKIGIYAGEVRQTLAALQQLHCQTPLVAVLFADKQPDFAILDQLHRVGFAGVMLDTADKTTSLPKVLPPATLRQFVQQARGADLLCGLAGSLRASDIAELLPLGADYLGFRGALCSQHQRTAPLDMAAVQQVLRYF